MRSVPLTMNARITSSLPAVAALFNGGPKVLTPSDGCRWQMPHDCAKTWRPSNCVCVSAPPACCAGAPCAQQVNSNTRTDASRLMLPSSLACTPRNCTSFNLVKEPHKETHACKFNHVKTHLRPEAMFDCRYPLTRSDLQMIIMH